MKTTFQLSESDLREAVYFYLKDVLKKGDIDRTGVIFHVDFDDRNKAIKTVSASAAIADPSQR